MRTITDTLQASYFMKVEEYQWATLQSIWPIINILEPDNNHEYTLVKQLDLVDLVPPLVAHKKTYRLGGTQLAIAR